MVGGVRPIAVMVVGLCLAAVVYFATRGTGEASEPIAVPPGLIVATVETEGPMANVAAGKLALIDGCLVLDATNPEQAMMGLALHADRVHTWELDTGRLGYGRQGLHVGQEVVVVGRSGKISHRDTLRSPDTSCPNLIEYLDAQFLLAGAIASMRQPEAD